MIGMKLIYSLFLRYAFTCNIVIFGELTFFVQTFVGMGSSDPMEKPLTWR